MTKFVVGILTPEKVLEFSCIVKKTRFPSGQIVLCDGIQSSVDCNHYNPILDDNLVRLRTINGQNWAEYKEKLIKAGWIYNE